MKSTTRTRQILVVLAHPDDETFICGGTMARYGLAGHRITLVCATRGEMGRRLGVPPIATRETLPVLREAELREACRALAISDLRLLGLRDKTLDYYEPQALADMIIPVMREVQPDLVLTFHERIGGHPDHCAIGRAARLAHAQAGGEARLYYLAWNARAELLEQAGMNADRVTEIAVRGEAARAKVAAYRAHRTQAELIDWLPDDKEAVKRLTGREYFLQGSGPARPGETDLLP